MRPSTAALVTLLTLGASVAASAQDETAVPTEVMIVLASETPGQVDPRLARVPALGRPPFDTYRSMVLLSSPRVTLRVGQEQIVRLPNGRRARLVLREITPEGRYRVRVSINRPDQNDYLPGLDVVASPGDPFFIAGQSFRTGTLVIGIRLGERPDADGS